MGPRGSDDRTTVTRRTVARTAAHAAWAVPVIAVATAAPAFAASNGPIVFTASTFGSGGGNTRTNINVQIAKEFGSPAVATTQVQVTLTPSATITMGTDVVITSSAAEFTVLGTPTVNGSGALVVSFTSVANPIFPASAYTQRTLSFNVGLTNPNFVFPRGTIAVTVAPSAGTPPTVVPSTY